MKIVKKIDIYLMRSFVGPFIVAFFIAIFVLVMQFLWSFIDDIIGKGVGTLEILELVFYNSLSIFPLALPIAVLLASVMVFGNLSEKYELSSLKSAGVSLVRIMMPVAFCAVLAAGFSLYCSDTLIPVTNLKFYSRLYDIRNQKPALSIEEGVFNDDFKGFSIRVGEKDQDNKNISDVLIYDHSTSTRRKYNMIKADRGQMYISDDDKYFVMQLFDGAQYREVDRTGSSRSQPFTRTEFSTWTKYFDMSEFAMGKTSEEYFKSHHKMKSVGQLRHEIDTIRLQYTDVREQGLYDFNGIFDNVPEIEPPGQSDATAMAPEAAEESLEEASSEDKSTHPESHQKAVQIDNPRPVKDRRVVAPIIEIMDTIPAEAGWDAVLAAYPQRTQRQFANQAATKVRSFQNSRSRIKTKIEAIETNESQHIYELQSKFSLAFICIIFLFIGAPMGAIVRKGGYGYPLLVAIIFFSLFIVLTLMFKKLTETGSVGPLFGAWAPCLLMLPPAILLTVKALRDTKFLDAGRLFRLLRKRVLKTQATG